MSISDANTSSQQVDVNSQRLSDLFRIGHLERKLKQALEELEQARTRVNQLEQEIASQNTDRVFTEKTQIPQQAETTSAAPPLPIAEIKQLAEMAKRFK